MLECLIQFPSLSGQWWPAEPGLARAIFFQFRQIPLNGANHTDKTDIPAFGMDTFSKVVIIILKELRSFDVRNHQDVYILYRLYISEVIALSSWSSVSPSLSLSSQVTPVFWVQVDTTWSKVAAKFECNHWQLLALLPQVSFHFRSAVWPILLSNHEMCKQYKYKVHQCQALFRKL